MLTPTEINRCTGCGLCAQVCPFSAISIEKDLIGHRIPRIDPKACRDCRKCESLCPSNSPVTLHKPEAVFATANKNKAVLNHSSSGGVFSALAVEMFRRGGVVYGAAMEPDDRGELKVFHRRATDEKELDSLRGSKYTESDIGSAYRQAMEDLKAEKPVLFTGTPCQVAAMRAMAGEKAKGLYTADIICHGVAPQTMFRDYIQLLEKEKKGKILGFSFRSKTLGWGLTGEAAVEKKKKVKVIPVPCATSSYYTLFLEGRLHRESCYACPYACGERTGDLTMGDFWGIEGVLDLKQKCAAVGISSETGASCVLANTGGGLELLQRADLPLVETSFEAVAAENAQLRHPSEKHPRREEALNAYQTGGYQAVERQFRKRLSFSARVKTALKTHLPRKVFLKAKKVLNR